MPGLQDKNTPDVTAEQVLDLTVETLQNHLNLSIDGSKCHTLDVLRLLLDKLRKRGFGIGRVVVIHTDDSQEPMKDSVNRLKMEFGGYYRRYGYTVEAKFVLLEGESGKLSDILTEEDAGIVFRTLYRVVLDEKRKGYSPN